MKYTLLNGLTLDLAGLPRKDLDFLFDLLRRAMAEEDYFDLERLVCGQGSYLLKGSPRVTREIHATHLFRVAEDIVDRVGIRQGVLAPDPSDERLPTEEVMSVTEAAMKLGISRAAVISAAHTGRIKGKKIGHVWALLRRSVETYKVAPYRIQAGQAAHAARSARSS